MQSPPRRRGAGGWGGGGGRGEGVCITPNIKNVGQPTGKLPL